MELGNGLRVIGYGCFVINLNSRWMEGLAEGISESIDELGSLLDHIYKYPPKQREQFYERIQQLKNKLLSLKGNLRESNLVPSEKQFKQIYLSVSSLKSEILSSLPRNDLPRKKEPSRSHEEDMKVLLEKDQRIAEITKECAQLLENKKELTEDIAKLKKDCEIKAAETRQLAYQHNQIKMQMLISNTQKRRQEEEIRNFQIREGLLQKSQQDLIVVSQLLREAEDKLDHFAQLADHSLEQSKIVQENMKRVEKDFKEINENCRIKEGENNKLRNQLQLVYTQVDSQTQAVEKLKMDNSRLAEEVAHLEEELSAIQNKHYEERSQLNLELSSLRNDYSLLERENECLSSQLQEQEKGRRQAVQSLERQLTRAVEEQKNWSKRMKELQNLLLERCESLRQCQLSINEAAQEGQMYQAQLIKINEQLGRAIDMNKELEQEAREARRNQQDTLRDKIYFMEEKSGLEERMKEIEKVIESKGEILSQSQQEATALRENVFHIHNQLNQMRQQNNQLQRQHDQLKRRDDQLKRRDDELEKQNDGLEKQNDGLEKQNDELEKQNDELEKQNDELKRQNDELKRRVLRAKIDAVHQIRRVIA